MPDRATMCTLRYAWRGAVRGRVRPMVEHQRRLDGAWRAKQTQFAGTAHQGGDPTDVKQTQLSRFLALE